MGENGIKKYLGLACASRRERDGGREKLSHEEWRGRVPSLASRESAGEREVAGEKEGCKRVGVAWLGF